MVIKKKNDLRCVLSPKNRAAKGIGGNVSSAFVDCPQTLQESVNRIEDM